MRDFKLPVTDVDNQDTTEYLDCPVIEAVNKCNHEWKLYTGLQESFEYCEACDAKK